MRTVADEIQVFFRACAWLSRHYGEIAALPEARKSVYDTIRDLARDAERSAIEIPTQDIVESVGEDGKTKLPQVEKHVLATAEGLFPLDAKLNRWERAVINHELSDCAGWYRNPSSASSASLRIAYREDKVWRSIQPDLLFVAEDGSVSIIDPHGAHLGDAKLKLDALTEYADTHGDQFARVTAIGVETDNQLMGLDRKDPKVRRAVYQSGSSESDLKVLYAEHGTKYAEADRED